MHIVIDIPEDYYKAIKEIPVEKSTADMMIIQYGTPLPKGHGRLIDADELTKEMYSWGMNDYEPLDFIEEVEDAPTIIEADKTESEG